MCLTAYHFDPVIAAASLKGLCEDGMELSFDVKEKLPEVYYLWICDILKKSYEFCDIILNSFTPEGCPKELLTTIKEKLAGLDFRVAGLIDLLRGGECDGNTIQRAAKDHVRQREVVGTYDTDAEDVVVVRFVHGGVSYFRELDTDDLYQVIEGENELVGRYNSATDTIDFDYGEDENFY